MSSTVRSIRIVALAALLMLVSSGVATAVSFVDRADEAGIDWVHASTTDADQNYPETNGSGVCWGDVDGDGTDDVLFVNGLYADDDLQAALDPRSALFLNRGDGTFTDASVAWGADVSGWGQGCSLVDHDADGDLDALIVGYDMLVLLVNTGTAFEDGTAASGLTLLGNCDENPHCFGETGAWGDYDGDGDLDVYITQYADYDIDAGGPVSPSLYNGMSNILFRNRLVEDGVATFDDVTDLAGVRDNPGPARSKSFQSAWADCDKDGDQDLYVASDTTPNSLYRNNGDGTFTDIAIIAGVDDSRASMGLVWQDIDHDGYPDLFFTHYEHENNGFFLNDGDCTFTNHSGEGGLGSDIPDVGWGAGAFDIDNDGRVDLFSVNGHTTPLLDHEQAPRLWLQGADGLFTDVSASAGPAFSTESVGRGAAAADYDLDGDLDIALLAHYNESARLLRSDGAGAGFLQIELVQSGPNPQAIGAEVTVTPTVGVPYTAILQAGNSFLGQHSLIVHAGLGAALAADVSVRWPDGTVELWPGLAADQRVRLVRGVSSVVSDTVSPLTDLLVNGAPLDSGWYPEAASVTLAVTDRAVGAPSGVAAIEIDTGSGWQPYTGAVMFTADGIHPVRARALDVAGNQEPIRSFEVGIDRLPPTTSASVSGTLGPASWYRERATVELAPVDIAAGVATTWMRLNDEPWVEAKKMVIEKSGEHTVSFYAVDRAGNVEPVRSVTVRVDNDRPTVTLREKPLAVGVFALEVAADAHDATSGIHRVAFFVDDETTPRAVDLDGADGWSWAYDGPGLARVRAVAYDGADLSASDETRVLYAAAAAQATIDIPLAAPLVLLPALLFSARPALFPARSFKYPRAALPPVLEVSKW